MKTQKINLSSKTYVENNGFDVGLVLYGIILKIKR